MASHPRAENVLRGMCCVTCDVIISVLEICVSLLNIVIGIISVAHKNLADLPVGICLIVLGIIFLISNLFHLQLILNSHCCLPPRKFMIPSLILLNLFTLTMVIITCVFIFTRDSHNTVDILVFGYKIIKQLFSRIF